MTGQYPRLRSHIRRRKSGEVVCYYVYDMRHEGKPDIPLGRDYAAAVEKWREIHEHKPRIAGTLLEAFERWEQEVLPGYENAGTRRTYATNMRRLKPVFGPATWDRVTLPTLKGYLKARSAKTQANREMALLSVVWNWARGEGLHELPWPAAGMEKARWRNKENPRRVKVSDRVFDAIYAEAEPLLRDCMDLASATGMRLTDCRTVALPAGDVLHVKASKTGKEDDFDVTLSQVLPALIARRRALPKAPHTMLLSTPAGKPVTEATLRGAYDRAREKAAAKARLAGDQQLADEIGAMFLRDCRKYAASKAGGLAAAQELLGHGDKRTTARHYYFEPTKKAPVK